MALADGLLADEGNLEQRGALGGITKLVLAEDTADEDQVGGHVFLLVRYGQIQIGLWLGLGDQRILSGLLPSSCFLAGEGAGFAGLLKAQGLVVGRLEVEAGVVKDGFQVGVEG
jgi:hypothetical protein